jgi:hypothetical protein
MKTTSSERRIHFGASDVGGSANARGGGTRSGTPPGKSKKGE